MAETTSLSKVDSIKEQVHEHISTNSWMNITNLDNWAIDVSDNPEEAAKYYGNPKFFLALDCETGDNAKSVLNYFKEIGASDNEDEPFRSDGESKYIFLFKTSM